MGFIALIFNQNAAVKIPKDNRISSVVTGDFQSSLLIFQVYVILLILLQILVHIVIIIFPPERRRWKEYIDPLGTRFMLNPPYHTMYPSWAFLRGYTQRHSEIEKASLYSNPMFCIYEIFLSISISSLQHFVSTTEKRNRRIFSFEIWECDCVYMTIKCRSTQTTTTAIAISYAPVNPRREITWRMVDISSYYYYIRENLKKKKKKWKAEDVEEVEVDESNAMDVEDSLGGNLGQSPSSGG